MHSTWPVYAQPDERQTTKDHMTLSVSRRRTCLATAGDQITMQATLFTDYPVTLKSFELALIQKIIYPNTGTTVGKRGPAATGPPPSRSSIISEQKRPQPALIQPGMHQTCELICMLPPNYSAMTVSTARLIENTYEVHVSAVLEGDRSISVGLPMTVSPFPVPYSMDMMQRMGMPPMALDHPSRAHLHQQAASISRPASAAASMLSPQAQPELRNSQYGPPTTAPPGRQQRPYHISERVGGQVARDDSLLGGPPSPVTHPPGNVPTAISNSISPLGATRSVMPDTLPVEVQRMDGYNEFGQAPSPPLQQRPPEAQPLTVTSPGPQTARFAVVNLTQRDEPDSPRSSVLHEPYMTAAEEKKRLAQQMRQVDVEAQAYAAPPPGPPPSGAPAAGGSSSANTSNLGSTPPKKKWLSAEEEKEKLFQKARDAAELTQRRAANSSNASASTAKASSPKAQKFNEGQTSATASQSPSSPAPVSTPVQKSSTSSTPQKWTSAEDEKRRLYERAQAKAMKTQAKAAAAGSTANVTRSNSIQSQNTSVAGTTNGTIVNPYTFTTQASSLKGSELYKSAMNNIKAPTPSTSQTSPGTPKPPSIQEPMTPPPITPPAQTPLSVPITPPPPSVTPSRSNGGWMTAEDEKARLRYLEAKRAVERHTALQEEDYGSSSSALDNGAYMGSNGYSGYASHSPSNDASWNVPPSGPPPPNGMSTPLMSIPAAITPPPPSSDPPAFEPSYGYTHATDIPEKEKLRLAQEARDAEAAVQNGYNHTAAGTDIPGYDEPPPSIPDYSSGGSPLPLSAADEKARLREQYASEENIGASGSRAAAASSSSNARAEPSMSADGGRMLTVAEERARLKALQAADRPISSVAPLPPPRIKSPPPSAPHSAASDFSKTAASSSYISSPAVSISSDDHLKRDPSIAQGKQRALTPSNASTNGAFVAPPPPPPLAPRPPKEYILQTKEQDAKIRRMTQETINLAAYGLNDGAAGPPWKGNDFSLGLRPFSPFNPSLDATAGAQASQGGSPLVNSVPRNYPQ
ncbi:hypothetical protein FRC20_011952 [Serendipita sp. 405]|nr:hypothetical protein FRC15_004231 [Serendipita sp. 397]KAG8799810.1 hypothetical protein FRC16_004323 [Serendipita sp. 398]KAG8870380.1 hypothetical protein FRC20_011952 [Serendipita sp. 405]